MNKALILSFVNCQGTNGFHERIGKKKTDNFVGGFLIFPELWLGFRIISVNLSSQGVHMQDLYP